MQTIPVADKNIQFLITANYQRMLSYEQAAHLTSEESFKSFYQARADESEANMNQLYDMLNMQPADNSCDTAAHPAFTHILHGKKGAVKILESIKTIEKTISKWYKNTIQEITGLPKEMIKLVEEQYQQLTAASMQLETL